jgi:hypothetical protein
MTTDDLDAVIIDHPLHRPALVGWSYVLAAPMAPGDPVEPVSLWCRAPDGCWWLVVDEQRVRRLTDLESVRAALHIPFESRSAADVDAIMGDLLPSPVSRSSSTCQRASLSCAETGDRARPALALVRKKGGT